MKSETNSKTEHKNTKSIGKKTVQASKYTKSNVSNQKNEPKSTQLQGPSYIINSISKENFDIMQKKFNITEIEPLQLKYVLKCIEGLYKNRFLYLTTHKQGEIIGSGNAKQLGLTLQIEGVGLSPTHLKLKFSGFKKFYVKDLGSLSGTWLKIPKEGVEIKNNDSFLIGPWQLRFQHSTEINQIQEICMMNDQNQLADLLMYNKIRSIPDLYRAEYQKFKKYPFNSEQIATLTKISNETKLWFNENKPHRNFNMYYNNEEIFGFSQQIGWSSQYIYKNLNETLLNIGNDTYLAEISKGRVVPQQRVFSRIESNKNYHLNLHDQIKIGNLTFELTRFNTGSCQDIGGRQSMEDCLIIQQDVGGSQWKLISLFAVLDGYGGAQCMGFIKQNLVRKIKQWTPMLDEAGNLNQMVRLLMSKTFYQLDLQFYEKYPDIANSCGATILLLMVIDSKIYAFNLGDNKGLLYRDDVIYKLNIDHIPARVDEKKRIQQAGGFVQYNRLNGKCTLSRSFGQFQYKDLTDYKNNMKGKQRSCLSCIPEVICFDIRPASDQFILLSTDGIFEVLNVKSVIDYILEKARNLEAEQNPDKIINSIIENCKITSSGCDNMSAILIFISKGKIGNKHSF